MSQPALELRDVSRRFGRRWAVRRVSARFEPGSLTLLLGANGAGKSTLLTLLAGAIRPTRGSLRAFGRDPTRHPAPGELRRRIAWLAHQPFLYPDLTGVENLRLVAGLYRRPTSRAHLDALLDRVGLSSAGRRVVRGYSRGMVQRLALARLLAQDADVWLLDEPTGGLDDDGAARLRRLVAEAREEGRCVLAATHAPDRLADLADHALELQRGRRRDGRASTAGEGRPGEADASGGEA